jgi:hypothetical protein
MFRGLALTRLRRIVPRDYAPPSWGVDVFAEDREEIERRIAELLKKAVHEENRERLGEILDKIRNWIALLQGKNDPPTK